LQGDKVGKDYLLQNLHRYIRTGLSTDQPNSTQEKAHFLAEKIHQIDYVNSYDNNGKSIFFHTKKELELIELLNIISTN
jgi:hypothetical protein